MTPAPIPKSKGNPFSVGYLNTREELAIFGGNFCLSRKRCEIGRWLLCNVNRKSLVPDWIIFDDLGWPLNRVSISLFQGHKITSRISQKRCVLGTKLLKTKEIILKEFWKSVNICRSYGQESSVLLFWLTGYSNGSISCHFWDIQCGKCRDLEIRIRVPSRSLKVVLFDRLPMVSY